MSLAWSFVPSPCIGQWQQNEWSGNCFLTCFYYVHEVGKMKIQSSSGSLDLKSVGFIVELTM